MELFLTVMDGRLFTFFFLSSMPNTITKRAFIDVPVTTWPSCKQAGCNIDSSTEGASLKLEVVGLGLAYNVQSSKAIRTLRVVDWRRNRGEAVITARQLC